MRRGPEDVPADRSLLAGTILANLVLCILPGILFPSESGLAAPAILELALMLTWLRLTLNLAHRPERFLQAATAVLGFRIVVAPAVLLVAWLVSSYGADKSWQLPMAMLQLAVGVWVFAITVRILRAATEWSIGTSIGLTIALQLVTLLIVVALFVQTPVAPVQT